MKNMSEVNSKSHHYDRTQLVKSILSVLNSNLCSTESSMIDADLMEICNEYHIDRDDFKFNDKSSSWYYSEDTIELSRIAQQVALCGTPVHPTNGVHVSKVNLATSSMLLIEYIHDGVYHSYTEAYNPSTVHMITLYDDGRITHDYDTLNQCLLELMRIATHSRIVEREEACKPIAHVSTTSADDNDDDNGYVTNTTVSSINNGFKTNSQL